MGSIPPCAKRPWGQNRRAFRGMWPIAGWFRRRASRISGSRSWRPHGGGRTITSFIILLAPARATSIGSRLLPANGAVQSIEDAAVLAKCLERADAHDAGAALQRYEQTRKPRASRCQEGSRRNAITYHLADGDDQRKRDADLASAADAPLPQNAWLYGHDVEAEFKQS